MKTALFEKISLTQFESDGGSGYDGIKLPCRATAGSAGYDFFTPFDLIVEPGQKVTVPTGVRCLLAPDKFLVLLPKSGLGTRYGLILANTVGIIDSDYSGAKNEGHILVTLLNTGSQTVFIQKAKAFAQGLILSYFLTDDDGAAEARSGGHGSTGA